MCKSLCIHSLPQPWQRLNSIRIVLFAWMLCIQSILGLVIFSLTLLGFGALSLICVPWMDLSMVVATFSCNPECFRLKDRLFLENYKCTRHFLQALLQSFPQATLTVCILSSSSSPNRIPILASSLSLASLNVAANLFYVMSQAKVVQGGGHGGLSTVALWYFIRDILHLRGATQVPDTVLQRSLGRMLRNHSDLVINEDLGREDAAMQQRDAEDGSNGNISRPSMSQFPSGGIIPLIPDFCVPWHSGILVPGQVLTLVGEIFSRSVPLGHSFCDPHTPLFETGPRPDSHKLHSST